MSENDVSLVLTVIGEDRPGLVEELARIVAEHGGNWHEASMAQLSGQFAGIVRVTVARQHAAALQQALGQITRLVVTATQAEQRAPSAAGRRLTLELVGHDRPGIVKEVAETLARMGVNVERLDTHTASAPMSAETLFHGRAELTAPTDLDTRRLKSALETLSGELMVDIHLGERL